MSVEIKGSNLEGGHCTFYLEGGALLASRSPSRECTIEDSVSPHSPVCVCGVLFKRSSVNFPSWRPPALRSKGGPHVALKLLLQCAEARCDVATKRRARTPRLLQLRRRRLHLLSRRLSARARDRDGGLGPSDRSLRRRERRQPQLLCRSGRRGGGPRLRRRCFRRSGTRRGDGFVGTRICGRFLHLTLQRGHIALGEAVWS